jgi:hypothetical protein
MLSSMPAELYPNEYKENGRGGWIRTNAWQDQNLLPYRLATPLYLLRRVPSTLFLMLQLASNIEMLRPYAISPVRASARGTEIYQLSLRVGRPKTKNLP